MQTLGTPVNTYDDGAATEWLDRVSDPLPLYRGRAALVHPSFFLGEANKALTKVEATVSREAEAGER